ncbi:MAG TPA: MFS transporter [Chloroflexia bacterium]|jgi:MFS family permease
MSERTEAEQGSAQASTEKVTFFTILRNRNFRNLWLGQIISQMGDYFAFLAILVVVGSFSQDVSETTQQVSIVMIASTLPRLLFGVLAGVFVDRWDRRLTMLASDLIRPALTLAMIPAFMSKNLWLMCILAFAMSAVGTFFNPAKGALIPKMMPTEHLTAANALSQTSMMAAFVLGPALSGAIFFLAGSGNEWIAFVLDATSYVVSAFAIWMIRMPKEDTKPAPETTAEGSALGRVGKEIVVGIKALAFNRVMATLSVVFAITMLGVGALNVLWVSFLKTTFGYTDSGELGWRFAVIDIAFFAGMVLASIAVGNFLSNRPPKEYIVWGLIVFGVGMLPLGYLPDYWLVVGVMFVAGLAVAPIETGVTTLMQISVPNHQLGRVGGGMGTVSETASLGSMGMAGLLGAAIGIPFVFLLSGVICILAGIVALAGLPNLTIKDAPVGDASATVGSDPQMAQVA